MCILLCSDHISIKLEKMLKEEEGERRRGKKKPGEACLIEKGQDEEKVLKMHKRGSESR